MVITLVGNKKDLDHKRSVSTEEGEAFARKHGLVFLEASAKTGESVEEAFITTSAKVLEQVNNGVFNLQDEVSRFIFIIDYLSFHIHFFVIF